MRVQYLPRTRGRLAGVLIVWPDSRERIVMPAERRDRKGYNMRSAIAIAALTITSCWNSPDGTEYAANLGYPELNLDVWVGVYDGVCWVAPVLHTSDCRGISDAARYVRPMDSRHSEELEAYFEKGRVDIY